MKRIGKSTAALVLCVVALISAVSPVQGASVYFMAVNDQLLELSDETMPAMVEGVLYVPYTLLSANATGVNLGCMPPIVRRQDECWSFPAASSGF